MVDLRSKAQCAARYIISQINCNIFVIPENGEELTSVTLASIGKAIDLSPNHVGKREFMDELKKIMEQNNYIIDKWGNKPVKFKMAKIS